MYFPEWRHCFTRKNTTIKLKAFKSNKMLDNQHFISKFKLHSCKYQIFYWKKCAVYFNGINTHLWFLMIIWLTEIFLFELVEVKWSEVTQSCPTLCDPMDCSPPGSSIHGVLQARILEWVAISFSTESIEKNKLISCRFVAFLWNDKLFQLIHTADSDILPEGEKNIISLIATI